MFNILILTMRQIPRLIQEIQRNQISTIGFGNLRVSVPISLTSLDMTHIQYQGETLPPFPLVLAFGQVLGKFHI